MRLRKLATTLMILTLPLFASQTTWANLISNGSFENFTGSLPDDWNPTGNLAVISSQGETDGNTALAFSFGNLSSDGVISQTFSTVANTTYDLTFDFGKFSVNQPGLFARLDVDVFDGTGFGGTQLLDQTVADDTPSTGSSDSPSVYLPFAFTFEADGTSTTLRFTDTSDPQSPGGGFDAMLDNVVVIPEPTTALLVLSAFACLLRRVR